MEIKSNQDSLMNAVIISIVGLLGLGFGISILSKGADFWGCMITIGVPRLTLYTVLDLWFTKTIYMDESNTVWLKIACCRFRLNPRRSFVRIDEMFILGSRSRSKSFTLNIYRNPKPFFPRLFKNKIRINVVTRDNIGKMKEQAKIISDTFGIRFMDVFDFE